MFQVSGKVAMILVASLGASDPQLEPGMRQVSIERARWELLRSLAEFSPPPEQLPGPWAAKRSVQLERRPEGLRIRARWQLQSVDAGWFSGTLIGPIEGLRVESVSWRGRSIGVSATAEGEQINVELDAEDGGELRLVAFIPAAQLPGGIEGDLQLQLMPAVRGELEVRGSELPPGRTLELVAEGEARRAIDGRFWGGEGELELRAVVLPADEEGIEAPLSVAQCAVGLTFGDGEVRGRARVSWLLRQGELDRVSIDASGLGRDLELAGPNVLEWSRSGDRLDITLKEPASGRIDVDLRWTEGLGSGDELQLSAPRITAGQAYRSEHFMQIARDGELEILPQLAGWAAVASTELPNWASGYIQGTATASYRQEGAGGKGSFELLRFVPMSGPPVMVDVAAYEVATTDEGRSLVQARYEVRNERASHLRAALPRGARMLGVRVNGEAVTPAREQGGSGDSETWRIPLVRSLESLEGALSFPVELIYIADAEDWDKKETRELQLPALDAPVAISRVRLYLPPRYQNRVELGDSHRVASFSEGEGITYGLGVGAGAETIAQADLLYRDALSAWMANDFEGAQSSLDELGNIGAANANIAGLQANLDLVQGRVELGSEGEGGQSAVVSRRIKAQAKQRAAQDEIELREREQEAVELEAQGRYEMAEEKLAEAQELGERLALLEQTESQEQVAYNQSLSLSSQRIAEKKKRKGKREAKQKKAKAKPSKMADFKADEGKSKGDLLEAERVEVVDSKDARVDVDKANEDGWIDEDEAAPSSDTAGARQYSNRVLLDEPPDYDIPANGVDRGNVEGLYDFESDLVDGSVLAPTGATVTATTTTEAPDEPMPEPEPEPIAMDEYAYEMPLEERDYEPMEAEITRPAFGTVGASIRNRRAGRARRGKKGGRAKNAPPAPPADNTATAAPAGPPPPPADPNAALAGPVAQASAVSVHIPAIGEAVLYQYMLLPEGQTLSVHLEARRDRRSRR